MRDAGSGLARITNTSATNGTVSVDPFAPATTQPVDVTVTKTRQTWWATLSFDLTGFSLEPTTWTLDATDVAGNTCRCAARFG